MAAGSPKSRKPYEHVVVSHSHRNSGSRQAHLEKGIFFPEEFVLVAVVAAVAAVIVVVVVAVVVVVGVVAAGVVVVAAVVVVVAAGSRRRSTVAAVAVAGVVVVAVVVVVVAAHSYSQQLQHLCLVEGSCFVELDKHRRNIVDIVNMWVVIKIMASFWFPIILRHLLFRVPKKGP